MKDIECPYCGEWQDVDHEDGTGYEEDQTYQQTCCKCEKVFVYTTGILYVYTPEKADCLNGGDHNFEPTHTFPKEYTKMRCTMCDEERDLTIEEKKMYKI